jgi:phage terminase Nu1 subunit (DNA packaging protein)
MAEKNKEKPIAKKRVVAKDATTELVSQNIEAETKQKRQTVTTEELAELCNLSVPSIKKLRQDGVIEPLPNNGNRKAGNEWLPLQCMNRVIINYQNMVDSRGSRETEEMKKARERQMIARAKKEELELAVREGELHKAEDIERVMGAVLTRLRINLLSIPKGVAPLIKDMKYTNVIAEKIYERIWRALNEAATLDLDKLLAEEEKGIKAG